MQHTFEKLPRELRDKIYENVIKSSKQATIEHRARKASPIQITTTHSLLLVSKDISAEYIEAIARYTTHAIFINRAQADEEDFSLCIPRALTSRVSRVNVYIDTWCDHDNPWSLELYSPVDVTKRVYDSVIHAYTHGEKEKILKRLAASLGTFRDVQHVKVQWSGRDWAPAAELTQNGAALKMLPDLRSFVVVSERKDKFIQVGLVATRSIRAGMWSDKLIERFRNGPNATDSHYGSLDKMEDMTSFYDEGRYETLCQEFWRDIRYWVVWQINPKLARWLMPNGVLDDERLWRISFQLGSGERTEQMGVEIGGEMGEAEEGGSEDEVESDKSASNQNDPTEDRNVNQDDGAEEGEQENE